MSNWYRVITSTLLEDRRDAVRAIKALAKKYKAEVGELCLQAMLDVIRKDRSDTEIVGYALECLWNVMEIERLGEGEYREKRAEVGFSKVVVSNHDNVAYLLELLEEFDFKVRRPATIVLWILLQNCREETQEAILVSPMGISRLMDLLVDSREVIRNDAILVLYELTYANKQIQKIVAFENAFDRLLAIIKVEGYSEGGIVVLDCVNVLQNLLFDNNSNQSFFREANLIHCLLPFFDFKPSSPGDNSAWNQPEKAQSVLQMLRLVRSLVSPRNPQQSTSICQKQMLQCGLLESLCKFMFGGGVPSEILSETINAVAEVVRGCDSNQQYLESVSTPSNPPRSAVLAILMSMVTEKQPLPLRLAALYCFQCFVYKNERSQQYIIDTLLPSSTAQQASISPGQILIAGLFGPDPLSNWCTSIAISNALNDSLKPQLLRVQLSMQGGTQVTLLRQITMFLTQHSDLRVQTRVGILILLCVWLANCSHCVIQFLGDNNNIPFLIGQLQQNYTDEVGQMSRCLCAVVLGIALAFNTSSSTEYSPRILREVIEHRIGKEAFIEIIGHISSSEFFTRAAKYPYNRSTSLGEICFDHNFTTFFKQVSEVIVKSLDDDFSASVGQKNTNQASAIASNSVEEHDSIISQYKELIRDQDTEITSLRERYDQLEKTRSQDARLLQQQSSEIKILGEQVALYASLNKSGDDGEGEETDGVEESEIKQLQNTITSMQRIQDSQRHELASKEVEIGRLQQELSSLTEERKQLDMSSAEDKFRMSKLKDELDQVKAMNEALLTDRKSMEEQLVSMEENLRKTKISQDVNSQDPPTEDVEKLQQETRRLQSELKERKDKAAVCIAEQDDLLMTLTDLDKKVKRYKTLLVENNVAFPESESEEDDDDDEEEEDEEDVD